MRRRFQSLLIGFLIASVAYLGATATRTFTAITGGGTGGAYIASDPRWGYQTAEKIRQNLDLLAYLGADYNLGGSETDCLITGASTWVPVAGYQAVNLNADSLGGLTVTAVTYYRTTNTSTAVQVRVRDTTSSSTVGTGTSYSATTTEQQQNITVTLTSGAAKSYRLEILGDATNAVCGRGVLRLSKTPV